MKTPCHIIQCKDLIKDCKHILSGKSIFKIHCILNFYVSLLFFPFPSKLQVPSKQHGFVQCKHLYRTTFHSNPCMYSGRQIPLKFISVPFSYMILIWIEGKRLYTEYYGTVVYRVYIEILWNYYYFMYVTVSCTFGVGGASLHTFI